MKITSLPFLLLGIIWLSSCMTIVEDNYSDLSTINNADYSSDSCEANYTGPGSIKEFQTNDQLIPTYYDRKVIYADDNHVYLFYKRYNDNKLICLDKNTLSELYSHQLPNRIKKNIAGKEIHSYKNELWCHGAQELVSINKFTGSKTIQLYLEKNYDEISRTQKRFIAVDAVDCSDENFIKLDFIDPATGDIQNFYTQSLGSHDVANAHYLGKNNLEKNLDLFLMNIHKNGEKPSKKIIAIDIKKKKIIWEQELEVDQNSFMASNPFIIMNHVLLCKGDQKYDGYDLNNQATKIFELKIEGLNTYSILAPYKETFIIFGGRKQIIQASSENGQILNIINQKTDVITSNTGITVSDNQLYVTQACRGLSIIKLDDLEQVTEINSPWIACAYPCNNFQNNIAVAGNDVYLTDPERIYQLSLAGTAHEN